MKKRFTKTTKPCSEEEHMYYIILYYIIIIQLKATSNKNALINISLKKNNLYNICKYLV